MHRSHRESGRTGAPAVVDVDRVPHRPDVVAVERDGLALHDEHVTLDPEERALEPFGFADVTPHRMEREPSEHTSILPAPRQVASPGRVLRARVTQPREKGQSYTASTVVRPRSRTTRHAVPPSTTTCQSARRRRVSHHRRSWTHGPLHPTNGPPPSGSAAQRRPAGGADGSPATRDRDRRTGGVDQLGRHRWIEDPRRRRPGHRTRPRGWHALGFVTGLTPRDPADPLGRSAAAAVERGDDCVGTEHPLHAGQRAPARSAAAGSPPQNPSWRPTAGPRSSGASVRRVRPAVTPSVSTTRRAASAPASRAPPV